jgi:F-type H+-transporting ATPase subunit a
MGEHTTWFDLLPGFHNLEEFLAAYFGRTWRWQAFQETHFTLVHVAELALVMVFLAYGALAWKSRLDRAGADPRARLVPPPKFNLHNLFEMFTDGVYATASGLMGPENAKKHLPLMGTFAFLIFFANALALIPGFTPPTQTLKTNFALSLTVFVLTHYYGVKEHGLAYFKHFLGPVWWMAPLMLPVELISHLVRPVSLALRLMGNMTADHMVAGVMFSLVPFIVPVPFLLLGVIVVIVQTFVFCCLTMVYFALAVAHEEH